MDVPESDRRAVYLRDESECVSCGSGLNLSVQHRQAVGMGGSNRVRRLGELLTACMRCNTGFEAEKQQAALRLGWKVERWVPAERVPFIPFWHAGQGWLEISPDGRRTRPIDVKRAYRLIDHAKQGVSETWIPLTPRDGWTADFPRRDDKARSFFDPFSAA